MIVKMDFGVNHICMVECDTVHINRNAHKEVNSFRLSLYKGGKLIEQPKFETKVAVFIMENGKTVDRIDYNPNDKQ